MTKPASKRCSECRKTFVPDVRVGQRQRVCSETCGEKRRRSQRRERRARDPARYRDEERARKRRSRERAGEKCHAPSETGNPQILRVKVDEFLDEAVGEMLEMSRTQLELQAMNIARKFRKKVAEAYRSNSACHAPSDLFISP